MSDQLMQAEVSDSDRHKARLAKNQAFWERGPATCPLFGVAVNITFPSVRFANMQISQSRMTPDMICPEAFLADWEQSFAHTEARGEDLFMVA